MGSELFDGLGASCLSISRLKLHNDLSSGIQLGEDIDLSEYIQGFQ